MDHCLDMLLEISWRLQFVRSKIIIQEHQMSKVEKYSFHMFQCGQIPEKNVPAFWGHVQRNLHFQREISTPVLIQVGDLNRLFLQHYHTDFRPTETRYAYVVFR